MWLSSDSWSKVFFLQTPLLELFLRGTCLYFGILILVRLMPRRSAGDLATMDLIFALLITNAAAHALGDYTSLADSFILIVTMMGHNYLVNALSYRIPAIERLVSAPPIQVVKDGRLLKRNMRREFLTEEELKSHLREQGIEEIKDIKAAFVEAEGHISVIHFPGKP